MVVALNCLLQLYWCQGTFLEVGVKLWSNINFTPDFIWFHGAVCFFSVAMTWGVPHVALQVAVPRASSQGPSGAPKYWKPYPIVGRNPANQLRLLVYLIIYKVLYIPGGCLGFRTHQQYHISPENWWLEVGFDEISFDYKWSLFWGTC